MKILFAGEGGQGVQAVAEILAKAGFSENQSASYIPNFGVEQRGGVSLAFVIVQKEPVVYPKFKKADITAIFSNRSIKRAEDYIDAKTKVVLGPAVTAKKMPKLSRAIRLKGRADRPPRTWNVVVLGEVNRQGKIVKKESLIKAMEERFARQFEKNPKLRELDLEALRDAKY